MLVCLRMAVVLHRSREDLPVMPNLKQTGNTYSLIFPKGWLEENPLTMAGLEKEVEYFLCAAIELKILEA
jgi:exopolyphosphatase/guanosine-5'-triphosphate,3'-diphosphate pyrophosphatase